MSKSVPDDVKQEIRSVLLSVVGGVELESFGKDYRRLVGYRLEWRKLGFKTLVELLQSIPDIARVEFCLKDDKYRVFGLGDPNIYMNITAKKAQYKPNLQERIPTGLVQHTPPAQAPVSARSMESSSLKALRQKWEQNLHPNPRGLWALCMPKNPRLDENSLEDAFRSFGDVAQTHATDRYLFVRFYNKESAMKALEALHDDLDLRPASEKAPTTGQSSTPQTMPPNRQRSYKTHSPQTEKSAGVSIYFGNLTLDTTEDDLANLLDEFETTRIKLIPKERGQIAFVTVTSQTDANRMISQLNQTEFNGRNLAVQESVGSGKTNSNFSRSQSTEAYRGHLRSLGQRSDQSDSSMESIPNTVKMAISGKSQRTDNSDRVNSPYRAGSRSAVEHSAGSRSVVEHSVEPRSVMEHSSGSRSVVEHNTGSRSVVADTAESRSVMEHGAGSRSVVEHSFELPSAQVEMGSRSEVASRLVSEENHQTPAAIEDVDQLPELQSLAIDDPLLDDVPPPLEPQELKRNVIYVEPVGCGEPEPLPNRPVVKEAPKRNVHQNQYYQSYPEQGVYEQAYQQEDYDAGYDEYYDDQDGYGEEEETFVLYVTNFPYGTHYSELLNVFQEYGAFYVHMQNTDDYSRRSAALVNFYTREEADSARCVLYGEDFNGRPLTISFWNDHYSTEVPTQQQNIKCQFNAAGDAKRAVYISREDEDPGIRDHYGNGTDIRRVVHTQPGRGPEHQFRSHGNQMQNVVTNRRDFVQARPQYHGIDRADRTTYPNPPNMRGGARPPIRPTRFDTHSHVAAPRGMPETSASQGYPGNAEVHAHRPQPTIGDAYSQGPYPPRGGIHPHGPPPGRGGMRGMSCNRGYPGNAEVHAHRQQPTTGAAHSQGPHPPRGGILSHAPRAVHGGMHSQSPRPSHAVQQPNPEVIHSQSQPIPRENTPTQSQQSVRGIPNLPVQQSSGRVSQDQLDNVRVTPNRSTDQPREEDQVARAAVPAVPLSMKKEFRQRVTQDCCPRQSVIVASDLPREIEILITDVVDSDYFWGQISNSSTFDEYTSLTQAVMDEANHLEWNPSCKSCVAMFEDNWFRGWIQNSSANRSYVFFVDFGNTEAVDNSCIRSLPPEFWQLNLMAVPFKLHRRLQARDLHMLNYSKVPANVLEDPTTLQDGIVTVQL